ncbi:MAG: DUF2333 family protein [Rhodospirillales bacterium]
MDELDIEIPKKRRLPGSVKKLSLGTLATVVVLAALYYPVGMILTHNIDDNPDFGLVAGTDGALAAPQTGGSESVRLAVELLRREVDTHSWTPNDPFFFPTAALDNMPNFQQGIVYALSRFAIEMADQIGRSRGSSQVDPNLDKASGLLKYAGDVWVWDPAVSLAPTATSEAQYRAGRRELETYNERLSRGEAAFERRADNLLATLERFSADIGSTSAVIDEQLRAHGGDFLDFRADDVFYQTKGRLYGYYILLRGLKTDFGAIITERQLDVAWDNMLASLRAAISLEPLVVVNGAPDSLFRPSHLTAQGFYLLRARTQIKEITNILLK